MRITRERSRRPRDLVTALDSAMRGSGAGSRRAKKRLGTVLVPRLKDMYRALVKETEKES